MGWARLVRVPLRAPPWHWPGLSPGASPAASTPPQVLTYFADVVVVSAAADASRLAPPAAPIPEDRAAIMAAAGVPLVQGPPRGGPDVRLLPSSAAPEEQPAGGEQLPHALAICMEFCDRGSLADAIQQARALPACPPACLPCLAARLPCRRKPAVPQPPRPNPRPTLTTPSSPRPLPPRSRRAASSARCAAATAPASLTCRPSWPHCWRSRWRCATCTCCSWCTATSSPPTCCCAPA
jgi:hypothetical protein